MARLAISSVASKFICIWQGTNAQIAQEYYAGLSHSCLDMTGGASGLGHVESGRMHDFPAIVWVSTHHAKV